MHLVPAASDESDRLKIMKKKKTNQVQKQRIEHASRKSHLWWLEQPMPVLNHPPAPAVNAAAVLAAQPFSYAAQNTLAAPLLLNDVNNFLFTQHGQLAHARTVIYPNLDFFCADASRKASRFAEQLELGMVLDVLDLTPNHTKWLFCKIIEMDRSAARFDPSCVSERDFEQRRTPSESALGWLAREVSRVDRSRFVPTGTVRSRLRSALTVLIACFACPGSPRMRECKIV